MSASEIPGTGRFSTPASRTPAEVVWHDLECGSYGADLPLWRELAEQSSGPVLDLGAGTGRVSLDLARGGHYVTALDLNPVLLDALRQRATGLTVETVPADARSFVLSRADFGLCIVPMQTIQLLGGADGRIALLRRARAHLREGGVLACAILSRLEPFACADGDIGPAAETAHVDGTVYVTRATRVAVLQRTVLIERERRVLLELDHRAAASADEPTEIARSPERDVIELDRLSASELEREAIEAGLHPEPAREVAPTADHVGSVVVMLRA